MGKKLKGVFAVLVTVAIAVFVAVSFQCCSDDDHVPVTTVDSIGGNFEFESPTGVAVDDDGNVYVVNGKIYKITPDNQVYEFLDLDAYSGNSIPSGVAVGGDGYIYITDTGIDRIWRFHMDGMTYTIFDQVFNNPHAVAAHMDGSVYVADITNIWKLGPGTSSDAFELSDVSVSYGVAVHTDGTTYASNTNLSNIIEISENGTSSVLADDFKFTYPYGVAVDKDKNVYVADRENSKVRKIDQDENVSTLAEDFPFISPSAIAVDKAGVVYVTDIERNRVYKIIKK